MKINLAKNVLFFVIITGLLSIGCGDGFSADSASNKAAGSPSNPPKDEDGTNETEQENENVRPDIDGKVDGGIWSGKEIVGIDWQTLDMIVKLPLDLDVGIVAGSIAIPKYEDITIEIVTTNEGTRQLQVRVPFERILGKHDPFMESGLPNGDPLPMVTGGRLPKIDTKIGKQDVHFYLGSGTIAVFVPTKFNPFITLVFPIKNAKGEALGYFATIAKKGAFKGGFYASIQLPKKILDQLDGLMPESNF